MSEEHHFKEPDQRQQPLAGHINRLPLESVELLQVRGDEAKIHNSNKSSAEDTYIAGSKLALVMVALCASMFLVALVSYLLLSKTKVRYNL
jgi:hypothetical protein